MITKVGAARLFSSPSRMNYREAQREAGFPWKSLTCTLLLTSPPSRGTRRDLIMNLKNDLLEHQEFIMHAKVDLYHLMIVRTLIAVTRIVGENIIMSRAQPGRR